MDNGVLPALTVTRDSARYFPTPHTERHCFSPPLATKSLILSTSNCKAAHTIMPTRAPPRTPRPPPQSPKEDGEIGETIGDLLARHPNRSPGIDEVATQIGFLDNRVNGGVPEDGWVGLTLNT